MNAEGSDCHLVGELNGHRGIDVVNVACVVGEVEAVVASCAAVNRFVIFAVSISDAVRGILYDILFALFIVDTVARGVVVADVAVAFGIVIFNNVMVGGIRNSSAELLGLCYLDICVHGNLIVKGRFFTAEQVEKSGIISLSVRAAARLAGNGNVTGVFVFSKKRCIAGLRERVDRVVDPGPFIIICQGCTGSSSTGIAMRQQITQRGSLENRRIITCPVRRIYSLCLMVVGIFGSAEIQRLRIIAACRGSFQSAVSTCKS